MSLMPLLNFVWIRPDMYEKTGTLDEQGAIDWAENIGRLSHSEALRFVRNSDVGDVLMAGDCDGYMMRVRRIAPWW